MKNMDKIILVPTFDNRGKFATCDILTGRFHRLVGTVVGFYSAERYIGRVGNYGQRPGKYVSNGAVRVTFPPYDRAYYMDGHSLILRGEPGLLAKRDTEYRIAQASALHLIDKLWIAELPRTPFWEFDVVCLNKQPEVKYRVERIGYGDRVPSVYDLKSLDDQGRRILFAHEEDLILVSRGNIWRQANGRSLSFESFEEETEFHYATGAYSEVRNQRRDNKCDWPIEDVEYGLAEGLIDVISMSHLFGTVHACMRCQV